mmetsp:Transcript_3307/g.2855  ORF Transcript_3307/g.2855 Transcript_3307/m.2855 type:complete len:129 (-) Transcript_3307:1458-1844(-)
MISMLSELVEKAKVSKKNATLILVGGGSSLVPENTKIEGVGHIKKPRFYFVANALGASLAQVSAINEEIVYPSMGLDPKTQLQTIQEKKKAAFKASDDKAKALAIARGAKEGTIQVSHQTQTMSYSDG